MVTRTYVKVRRVHDLMMMVSARAYLLKMHEVGEVISGEVMSW